MNPQLGVAIQIEIDRLACKRLVGAQLTLGLRQVPPDFSSQERQVQSPEHAMPIGVVALRSTNAAANGRRISALAVEKGFTDAELSLAREGMLKDRQASRAEDESLVGMLLQQLDLGRTMAFEQALDEQLGKLTSAQVNATLKKYVDPKRFSAVKAGDFKTVAAPK